MFTSNLDVCNTINQEPHTKEITLQDIVIKCMTISSGFSRNSEAFASQENLKETFPQYR